MHLVGAPKQGKGGGEGWVGNTKTASILFLITRICHFRIRSPSLSCHSFRPQSVYICIRFRVIFNYSARWGACRTETDAIIGNKLPERLPVRLETRYISECISFRGPASPSDVVIATFNGPPFFWGMFRAGGIMQGHLFV